MTPAQSARLAYRQGLVAPTAGVAPGLTQANLIALPRDWAWDFLLFAQRNPKPCPVLDVTEPGSFTTVLAQGADLRTDLPLYRVWRDGRLAEETPDARALWNERPDLVTFLIGCSFTFETPLAQAGIEVRHIALGCNVPMFKTNIACRISGRYPGVHGAPVHVGDPAAIGIADVQRPDFGDAVPIRAGEVPVFWACGVTPQAAVMASGVPFAITHAPGHMFMTDVADEAYHA